MKNRLPHVVDDVLLWAKTLTIDLPLASTQWVFGTGKEETATAAAWQGYDAGVRLLTAAVDSLYRTSLTSTVFDRTVAVFLRWQHVSHVMTDAAFSRLWHTIDLPTARQLHALEGTIAQLMTEVHEQRDAQEVLLQLVARFPQATNAVEQADTSRSGFQRHAASRHQVPLTVTRLGHHKGN